MKCIEIQAPQHKRLITPEYGFVLAFGANLIFQEHLKRHPYSKEGHSILQNGKVNLGMSQRQTEAWPGRLFFLHSLNIREDSFHDKMSE